MVHLTYSVFVVYCWQDLLRGFPDHCYRLQRYREELRSFQRLRWDDAWNEIVRPLFDDSLWSLLLCVNMRANSGYLFSALDSWKSIAVQYPYWSDCSQFWTDFGNVVSHDICLKNYLEVVLVMKVPWKWCSTSLPLAAEHTGQVRQSSAHFLCPIVKHCCLPYYFSASKLVFLPFHIELIRIIMHASNASCMRIIMHTVFRRMHDYACV